MITAATAPSPAPASMPIQGVSPKSVNRIVEV